MCSLCANRCFNPRPPYEGRLLSVVEHLCGVVFQSTPPIRGATNYGSQKMRGHLGFNPRPPYEGRLCHTALTVSALCFNPRPPYEGRHLASILALTRLSFNPRPPYEGRLKLVVYIYSSSVSIHAPHTRGDIHGSRRGLIAVVSIHAPHTRGDFIRLINLVSPESFNPRPPYEGRLMLCAVFSSSSSFNPRPPYEGRLLLS